MGFYIKTKENKFFIREADTYFIHNECNPEMLEINCKNITKLMIPSADLKFMLKDISFEEYQTLGTDFKRGCILL